MTPVRILDLPSWAVVSPQRAVHIASVAALMQSWAAARVPNTHESARWHRAAVLHDALRDAEPEALRPQVDVPDLPPTLWHGPAAAAVAAGHGETDRGVLEAVRWHSVGSAGWDDVGKALYLADYLEPGRTHDPERHALAARMPHEFDAVLTEVAARRIGWLLRTRRAIRRETWEFWNGLAAGGSRSP